MRDYSALEALAAKSPRLNDMCITTPTQTFSMRSDFGLWLNKGSPVVGKLETDSMLVEVPGADFLLDLTRAVDGSVHHKKRKITMEFVCDRPKVQWASIRAQLEALLQGQWLRFYFTRDGELWDGLFDIEMKPGDRAATVSITATCDPFRKGLVDAAATAILGKAVLGSMTLGNTTPVVAQDMQGIAAQAAGYQKQNFRDGDVLYADQLNRIEDSIAWLNSGLSDTEKQLILTLLDKSAYTDADAETAYNALAKIWKSEG